MFVGRDKELKLLKKTISRGRFVAISGRRRVGKSQLVKELSKELPMGYSQAIEGSTNVQLEHTFNDLKEVLPFSSPPTSWIQLLDYFAATKKKTTIVLDEFPYLVKSTKNLPSILQDWLDNKAPPAFKLILLGSSQSVMNYLFDSSSSPLFGRTDRLLNLKPLTYRDFCEYTGSKIGERNTFIKFSLVGGVPGYWRFISPDDSPLDVSEDLFFGEFSRLENEPDRLLKDEDVDNLSAKAVLEAVGRGSSRSSEIAQRLNVKQSSLPNTLNMLLKSSFISKMIPFGESSRTTKRSFYTITDPVLKFWYNVYSPHRTRWYSYDKEKKTKLLQDHASQILEQEFRNIYPDACFYWEAGAKPFEFDSVRFAANDSSKKVVVTEIKWRDLEDLDTRKIRFSLEHRFEISKLSSKYQAQFEVLGFQDIMERFRNFNSQK